MPTFGEKLRALRKQQNLTLRQLAEILSTSSGYIADLESGRREPSLDLACKVADFFGISIDQLAKDKTELD